MNFMHIHFNSAIQAKNTGRVNIFMNYISDMTKPSITTLRSKIIYIVASLFFFSTANGQQFGGIPPSTDWKQVNTPVARIIFPQQLDSAANRIANIFSYLNSSTQNTIG